MTKKYKIYTRTGDDGSTGLVGGARTRKNSLRITACGEIDTLNSYVGLARAQIKGSFLTVLDDILEHIQHELFNIGAEIATPIGVRSTMVHHTTKTQHLRLEEWIDILDETLPALRSFILPAGDTLVSLIHVSRAQCRTAERVVISLADKEKISKEVLIYLNRLSDLLFVMARYAANKLEVYEVPWNQKKVREGIALKIKNSSHKKKRPKK